MAEFNEKKEPKKVKRQISEEDHEKFLKDINSLPDTNTQIAAAMGIDDALVSNYKSGDKWPGSRTLNKFYSIFSDKLDALAKNNKPSHPPQREYQKELNDQTAKDGPEVYKTDPLLRQLESIGTDLSAIRKILESRLPDKVSSREPEKE